MQMVLDGTAVARGLRAIIDQGAPKRRARTESFWIYLLFKFFNVGNAFFVSLSTQRLDVCQMQTIQYTNYTIPLATTAANGQAFPFRFLSMMVVDRVEYIGATSSTTEENGLSFERRDDRQI